MAVHFPTLCGFDFYQEEKGEWEEEKDGDRDT